jgi:hypothetical protein
MLKHCLIVAVVMACLPPPRPALALDLATPVSAGDSDLNAVRQLRARFGGPSIPPDPLSRGEAALQLAALAGEASSSPAGAAWQPNDYDSLFALLQKYRDELRALGFQQSQLENEMAALKVHAKELQDRLDKLQPMDGMKINGKVTHIFDDMLLSGPGWNKGAAVRYREGGFARADLDLRFTRGLFSGEAEYYILTDGTNSWNPCATCTFAVTAIHIEIRTPVAFEAGYLDTKFSPLTLWRNEDEQPYEPTLFKLRRQELRDQLKLQPDALRLKGLNVSTDLTLFNTRKVELSGYIFTLGYPGEALYSRGTKVAPLGNDAGAGEKFIVPYSTYMGAWRSALPFESGLLAYNGVLIRDLQDSAAWFHLGGPVKGQPLDSFENQIHGAEAEYKIGDKGLARVEAATSYFRQDPYVNSVEYKDASTGVAMNASLKLAGEAWSVKAMGRNVDQRFYSPAAQSRTENPEFFPLGPFITENSLYNPSNTVTGAPYGNIGSVPNAPESFLNAGIVPSQVLSGGLAYAYRVPFDYRINASSPYGLATPNRQGGGLEGSLNLFKKSLVVSAMGDFATELAGVSQAAAVTFMVYRAGATYDLQPILGWPLSFGGGYTSNDLRNGGMVAFTSTLVDLGIDYQLSKSVLWSLGGRHIDYNGTLPYTGAAPADLAAFGYASYDQGYNIGGLGVSWNIAEGINLRANFSSLLFYDVVKGESANWQADQAYVQTSMSF